MLYSFCFVMHAGRLPVILGKPVIEKTGHSILLLNVPPAYVPSFPHYTAFVSPCTFAVSLIAITSLEATPVYAFFGLSFEWTTSQGQTKDGLADHRLISKMKIALILVNVERTINIK